MDSQRLGQRWRHVGNWKQPDTSRSSTTSVRQLNISPKQVTGDWKTDFAKPVNQAIWKDVPQHLHNSVTWQLESVTIKNANFDIGELSKVTSRLQDMLYDPACPHHYGQFILMWNTPKAVILGCKHCEDISSLTYSESDARDGLKFINFFELHLGGLSANAQAV